MEYCEHCNQPFKTVQGLSGHNRMKHSASNGQNSSEQRPSNGQNSSEQLQERLVQEFEERLLEEIQPQLERIERAAFLLIEQVQAAAIEAHRHGVADPDCPGCIEVVSRSLNDAEQQGVAKTVSYYEEIPGVKEQVELYETVKANTAKGLVTVIG